MAHIYKKTGNLRAVQLLLGHKKLESTVQYLGTEVDDAWPSLSKLNCSTQWRRFEQRRRHLAALKANVRP